MRRMIADLNKNNDKLLDEKVVLIKGCRRSKMLLEESEWRVLSLTTEGDELSRELAATKAVLAKSRNSSSPPQSRHTMFDVPQAQ